MPKTAKEEIKSWGYGMERILPQRLEGTSPVNTWILLHPLSECAHTLLYPEFKYSKVAADEGWLCTLSI